MAGYSQFDPRGAGLNPSYGGPMANTGTIYNPSGAAGTAALIGRPAKPMGPGLSYAAPNPFKKTGGIYDAPGAPPGSGAMGWPSGQIGNTGAPTGTTGTATGGGITAGTVPMPQIANAMRGFGFNQAPGVPVSPDAFNSINGQYGQAMQQGLNVAGLDFARNAAFENSTMDLARQRAQSDAALGQANLLARLFEIQSNGQNAQANNYQSLLQGLVG